MARQSLIPGESMVHISIAIRPSQATTLRVLARQEEASLSTLLRRAVDAYIAERLGQTERRGRDGVPA